MWFESAAPGARLLVRERAKQFGTRQNVDGDSGAHGQQHRARRRDVSLPDRCGESAIDPSRIAVPLRGLTTDARHTLDTDDDIAALFRHDTTNDLLDAGTEAITQANTPAIGDLKLDHLTYG